MTNRKHGKATKKCRLCNSHDRVIRKYNLYVCGRCFREVAPKMGFKKYS
jgi:small subunit ribosomal protein S14